jgi:phosphoribosyl 1,2-cyclic phosphodiesterase
VGNDQEAVLVDAGISCRETERRMKRLGLTMEKVKAVFISHEHSDHIRGLGGLAKKYRLPVYSTTATHRFGGWQLESSLVKFFRSFEPVNIGGLTVTPFPKLHDAVDPFSFTIEYDGIKVGVFTDIGAPCAQLIRHFQQCHAAFLESNYDEAMLANGHYPAYLKHRIRGGKGHLSNRQALELFCTHRPAHMTHLLLAHLSENNNCPKLVQQLFDAHSGGVQIVVATRTTETEVFRIHGRRHETQPHYRRMQAPQLALFE